MRGRGILLAVALIFGAGLLFALGDQPAGLLAQDSPLSLDSPLPDTVVASDTPQPTATATAAATATVAPTVTATSSPVPTAAPTQTPTVSARAAVTGTSQPLTPGGASPSAQGTLDLEKLGKFITDALKKYDVPGAAVAIVAGDEVIFAEGYGVRQLGDSAPVDANTRFEIASISKFLLASAGAALVDSGTVELDRPVVDYLPGFALSDAYAGENSTLRDLLAHRTGLPAYTGDLLDKMGFDRSAALTQLRFLPPAVTFREQEGYTNLGYFAAGEVMAAADGKPWEEIVAERIFAPLAMTRSSGYYDALLEDDNAAAAHYDAGDGVAVGEWADQPILGAGGQMVATLADMTNWVRMLLNGGEFDGQQVLAQATVQELFSPAIVGGDGGPLHDPLAARCLGCETYYYRGHRIVEATGAVPGARSLVLLAPDEKLGLIVFANRNLTAFPEAVRAEFLQQAFGPADRDLQADARALQRQWTDAMAPPAAPADPYEPTFALTDYAGDYTNDFYGVWTISSLLGEDKLEVAAGLNGFPGELLPHDGDTLLLIWRDSGTGNDLLTFTVENDAVTGFSSAAYGEFTRTGP